MNETLEITGKNHPFTKVYASILANSIQGMVAVALALRNILTKRRQVARVKRRILEWPSIRTIMRNSFHGFKPRRCTIDTPPGQDHRNLATVRISAHKGLGRLWLLFKAVPPN
jgi:hypothetical protein